MESQKFRWSVDDSGYSYKFSPELVAGDNLLHSAWERLDPHNRAGLAVLSQLVDEDLAVLKDGHALLTHAVIADLNEEELRAIGLPELYPYDIEVTAQGNLTKENFQYRYTFLNGIGQLFVNPTRIGTFLKIEEDTEYLIISESFRLLEAIDYFNSSGRQDRVARTTLLAFSDIKGLANATGAKLDNYLNAEEVIRPQKLGVKLRKLEDGSVDVLPLIGTIEESEDSTKSSFKSSVEESFIDAFDHVNSVRDIYVIKGGPRVVLDEEQKNALQSFKELRQLDGEAKESFLGNPPVTSN